MGGAGASQGAGQPQQDRAALVSVLCDDNLHPHVIYVLRVPLTDGVCTAESQLTLQIFTMRDCVTSRELVEHHGAGWPADLRRQLAIALDVPLARLCVPLRVGALCTLPPPWASGRIRPCRT